MSATQTKATPTDLRADLQRLLSLAVDVMSAEAKLEAFAEQLGERDGDAFEDKMRAAGFDGNLHHVALSAAREAWRDAQNLHEACYFYGPQKAQSAQDALDVFDFVARRLDIDEEWIDDDAC